MPASDTLGNAIALALACLFTVSSQAHFTAQYTPGLATSVERTTEYVSPAFEFSGLSVEQLKQLFGTLAAATAVFLWLPQTRRLGCRTAAFVTFAARIYPVFVIENYAAEDMVYVAGSAAAATAASVLLAD